MLAFSMKLGAHSSLTQQAIDERPNVCAYFVDNSTYSVSGVVLFSHVRPSGHGVRLRASAALVATPRKNHVVPVGILLFEEGYLDWVWRLFGWPSATAPRER